MVTSKILNVIIGILSIIVIPVQLVTTLVLGLLVQLTFGLLLLPFSLVWVVCFFGPLLGLSWLWQHARVLRFPLALLGVPLAVLGNTYTVLLPSMGETDSRISKLMLCSTWPFSLQCWGMITKQCLPPGNPNDSFARVLYGLAKNTPPWIVYLESIGVYKELEYQNGI